MLAGVCRLTGAEPSEMIARLLSVAAVLLYVGGIYYAAARMFTRPCGFVAGTMALCSWVVFDYGSRAELDMTFTAWVTLSQLCLYGAIRNRGALQWVAWTGVYFAATVATLAKGPHAVISVGLTMLGWSWKRRDFRWLFRPAHLVPAGLAFAIIVAWAVCISAAVGPSQYGRSAAVEAFIRLVPWRPHHLLSWLWTVPVFVFIALPASMPALAMVSRSARPPEGTKDREAVDFALIWCLTNLAFLIFAPAKASRYMLPVFGPVALLGAVAWRMFVDRTLPAVWDRAIRRFSGSLFVVGLACATAGFALAVQIALTQRLVVWPVTVRACPVILATSLAAVAVSLNGLGRLRRDARPGLWPCLATLLILMCPVRVAVYNPLREACYSQKPLARALDEQVPPDRPVLVYGTSPMPEVEVYSRRYFAWPDPDDPNAGRTAAGGNLGYYLVHDNKDWEQFRSRLKYAIVSRAELPVCAERILLVTVDFSRGH
jgi:4-amino-4-deoxy-L-arabinose transferase-like glycosyltransferase